MDGDVTMSKANFPTSPINNNFIRIPSPSNSQKSSEAVQSVPSSDLQGALSSLKDGKWLSSTTIEQVLDLFTAAAEGYHLIDHTFIPIDALNTLENKKSPHIDPNEHTLILPILYKYHWTVSFWELNTGKVEMWDSRVVDVKDMKIEEILHAFGQFLKKKNRFTDLSWNFEYKVFDRAIWILS